MALIFAVALLGVAGAGIAKWASRRESHVASVIAYRATGDDAVLVWTDFEKSWLSRIDGSGETRWITELPDGASLGDNLHLSAQTVAIRFQQDRTDSSDLDLSIAGFSKTGERVWTQTLARFRPQSMGSLGPTSPQLPFLSGIATASSLIEWTDNDAEVVMTGIDARTGKVRWQNEATIPPDAAYVFGETVLWLFRSSALDRAARPDHRRVAVINSTDVSTGATSQVIALGNGCVVGDDYINVIESNGEKQLVAFSKGQLSSRRVLGPFNPRGATNYFIHACGSYGNHLTFVVEWLDNTENDGMRSIVISDRAGTVEHSINAGFDVEDFLGEHEVVRTRFPSNAALSGELTRFVPLMVTDRD